MRIQYLLSTLLVCFAANSAVSQTSFAEFQKVLQEKAAFEQEDFCRTATQPACGATRATFTALREACPK